MALKKLTVNGTAWIDEIYEHSVALSSKYAPISHTHTKSQITDLDSVENATYAKTLGTADAGYTYSTLSSLLAGKSDTGHTHLYAGSDSAGGSANKIKTEAGTTNVDRPVFFAYNGDTTRVVFDNDFKYNPSSNTLTIGSGTLTETNYSGNAATSTSATTAGTAGKTQAALTFGTKTFNGSTAVEITAADLGLSSALKFLGVTTTVLEDGSTTNPIVIGDVSITAQPGNVVLYDHLEFIWNDGYWEELGDEKSFALKSVQISAGSGLTGGGTLEATRTLSHYTPSTVATNLTASGRQYITGLTFDDFGHVTGYSTGIESDQTTISGNAGSASKLTSSAGSATLPVYFDGGVPKAINTTGVNISITGSAASATNDGDGNIITETYATNTALAGKSDITHTHSEYALTTAIPTSTSQLTNDSGFLTEHQDLSSYAKTANLATVATTGSYNDLTNKPTIPSVGTIASYNVSFVTQSEYNALSSKDSNTIYYIKE